MENKEFSLQLEKRTKKFALIIIRLSGELSSAQEVLVIRHQLTNSGSSIGVVYREANRAPSRAEFAKNIRDCELHASETVYWLEIIKELQMLDSKLIDVVLQEANELLEIFTSIRKNLKRI